MSSSVVFLPWRPTKLCQEPCIAEEEIFCGRFPLDGADPTILRRTGDLLAFMTVVGAQVLAYEMVERTPHLEQ